jgi:hypothetical protein
VYGHQARWGALYVAFYGLERPLLGPCPANAERRRRGQSRGGKNKPSRELAGIKQRLSDLADEVLEEKVDKGVAAVASQVLNVYLRAVSVELKAREQLELIERLEALEEALEQKGTRYGA